MLISKAWDEDKMLISKAWDEDKMLISKAWDESKMLISKAWNEDKMLIPKAWDEDLWVDYFQQSTQSSRATLIGCTSGAPNESLTQKDRMLISKA
jgi:hypothetical protein